jgi:hypothetical protein
MRTETFPDVPAIPMYIVEDTSGNTNGILARKLCDIYDRGYFVAQIIPRQTSYTIIAYRRKN